jgi:hypothetical protein
VPDGSAYGYERDGALICAFNLTAAHSLHAIGNAGTMHIASASDWFYKGEKVELTHALFDAWIARFSLRKAPLVVDYFHGGAKATAIEPEEARAAGWIHAMWRQGEGADAKLFAAVEWNERAAKMIRAGEMRFCSPEFGIARSVHTGERGPELVSVALTNRPHQDNLEAIMLTREPPVADDDQGDKKDAPPADKPAVDDAKKLESGDAPKPAPDGDKPPPGDAPPADAPPAGDAAPAAAATDAAGTTKDDASNLMELASTLSKELGLDLGSTVAKMQGSLSAIVMALGGNQPQPAGEAAALFTRLIQERADERVVALTRENAELAAWKLERERIDATAAEAKAAEAKTALDAKIADRVQKGIDDGCIHIGRREDAIKAFTFDWDFAERHYADVVIPLEGRGAATTTAAVDLTQTRKFTRDDLTEGELLSVDSIKNLTRDDGTTVGEPEAIAQVVALRRK